MVLLPYGILLELDVTCVSTTAFFVLLPYGILLELDPFVTAAFE